MIIIIRRAHPFCGEKNTHQILHSIIIIDRTWTFLLCSIFIVHDSCSQHISTRWSNFGPLFFSLQFALLHFTAHNHLMFWSNLLVHICQKNRHFGFQSPCLFGFLQCASSMNPLCKKKTEHESMKKPFWLDWNHM